MNKIKVVDAPCGIGKSTSAINMINAPDNIENKYLYITPFLTELERIKKSCSVRKFKEPKVYGTKINGLKHLLSNGDNIVSTHALFGNFDEESIDITRLNDYILILDEVAEVVEPLHITKHDLETILEKYTYIDEDNMLVWVAEEYDGVFERYKNLCDLKCISVYKTDKEKFVALLWFFPVSVFKAFKEVYILTYMFNAQIQKYYYDYHGVTYDNIYVKDFNFTVTKQEYDISNYKERIHILDNDKLNQIGDLDSALSVSWFERNKNNAVTKQLKKNCINFFQQITKTPSNKNMWTTFKKYAQLLKGQGYTKGFVSVNSRATNDYIEKTSLAYLCNRYLNPVVKNFFSAKGIEVDEDLYALSELIQWMFRSAIRENKEIDIYLPSSRMRGLLQKWDK